MVVVYLYKLFFSFYLCGHFLPVLRPPHSPLSRPQVEVPDLLERRWSGSRGIGDICPLWPRALLSGALHENVSKGPSFIALQKLILVLNSKEAESHVCTLNIFIADAYR